MAGIEVCLQVAILNIEAIRDFDRAIETLRETSDRSPWDRELPQVISRLEKAAKSIVLETPEAIERRKIRDWGRDYRRKSRGGGNAD